MKLLRETSKISCRFVLGSEAHILVSPPPLKNNILVLASTTTKSCMYTTHSTGYNMVSEAQVQSYVRENWGSKIEACLEGACNWDNKPSVGLKMYQHT